MWLHNDELTLIITGMDVMAFMGAHMRSFCQFKMFRLFEFGHERIERSLELLDGRYDSQLR